LSGFYIVILFTKKQLNRGWNVTETLLNRY